MSTRHPQLFTKQRNGINQQTLSLSIASLIKNGIMLNKPSSGKNPYSVKPSIATEQIAATPSPLGSPPTPSPSAPMNLVYFLKIMMISELSKSKT